MYTIVVVATSELLLLMSKNIEFETLDSLKSSVIGLSNIYGMYVYVYLYVYGMSLTMPKFTERELSASKAETCKDSRIFANIIMQEKDFYTQFSASFKGKFSCLKL